MSATSRIQSNVLYLYDTFLQRCRLLCYIKGTFNYYINRLCVYCGLLSTEYIYVLLSTEYIYVLLSTGYIYVLLSTEYIYVVLSTGYIYVLLSTKYIYVLLFTEYIYVLLSTDYIYVLLSTEYCSLYTFLYRKYIYSLRETITMLCMMGLATNISTADGGVTFREISVISLHKLASIVDTSEGLTGKYCRY